MSGKTGGPVVDSGHFDSFSKEIAKARQSRRGMIRTVVAGAAVVVSAAVLGTTEDVEAGKRNKRGKRRGNKGRGKSNKEKCTVCHCPNGHGGGKCQTLELGCP